MKLDSIIGFLQDDLAQVERLLREANASIAPLVSEIGAHTYDGGGKRIRPVLVLLAARMCGYRGPRAVQVASACEMLHTATLLHDDVVDQAATRRGRPSVNALWGERLAILVGDFLLARASQTLVEDGNLDILWSYTDTIRQMSEGEVLQLQRSFDARMPESVYLEVIGCKTSTLLATAAESGAILGGVTRAERKAVRDYGWELGLAFQLVDDALDYVGAGEELGKVPLTDLAEGKVTMPLIATLRRCTTAEREAVSTALKSFSLATLQDSEPDRESLHRVAGLVRRYGGHEITLDRARQRAHEACAKIAAFADNEAKRALFELAEFVVRRRT